MALGKYIVINNVTMPNPTSFSYSLNPKENIFMSEDGTEMSNIVRLDRPSWSASFNCSSRLRDTLVASCKTASVTCQIDSGTSMTGRLRLSGPMTLVEGSEDNTGTQGLWKVSVSFEGE